MEVIIVAHLKVADVAVIGILEGRNAGNDLPHADVNIVPIAMLVNFRGNSQVY